MYAALLCEPGPPAAYPAHLQAMVGLSIWSDDAIATDSQGNIYTTETFEGKRVQKFVDKGLGPVTSRNQGVVWPTTSFQ